MSLLFQFHKMEQSTLQQSIDAQPVPNVSPYSLEPQYLYPPQQVQYAEPPSPYIQNDQFQSPYVQPNPYQPPIHPQTQYQMPPVIPQNQSTNQTKPKKNKREPNRKRRYGTKYHEMTVEQWVDVSTDYSPYVEYWRSQESFIPEVYIENTKKEKKWRDFFWAILFYINFLATIVLAIVIFCDKKPTDAEVTFATLNSNTTYSNESTETNSSDWDNEPITTTSVIRSVGLSLALAAIINIVHFCFACFAPAAYIKFGLFITFVVFCLFALVPTLVMNLILYIIIPAFFFLIVTIILFCESHEYFNKSAAILKKSCDLIRAYPSIVFLCFLQSIAELIVNAIFGFLAFQIYIKNWSYGLYVYVVFSYYWILKTFGYVTYMTGAGLASSWYFLNNTGYFPNSPVLESFKRAVTTSFGSASFGGLILAIFETYQAILNMILNSNSGDGCLFLICCLCCCFACLECLVKWVTHYALIYSAIFGIPYGEGARRWTELCTKRFVDVLVGNCVINRTVTFNLFAFMVGSALLGFGIGAIWGLSSGLMMLVFSLLFTLCLFTIFEQPILTLSDTLFVCFAEAPERLKTTASDLYDIFVRLYNKSLDSKIYY